MAWRLEPAVVRHRALVAEHDAVLDGGAAADVAVPAQNRPAHDRFLADPAVGPHDRLLDDRVFFDVALTADHTVGTDARAGLDDGALVDETGTFEAHPLLDAG